MSNSWNSKLDDLPVPNTGDAKSKPRKRWFIAQFTRLVSKLSRRMKRSMTIVTLVVAVVLAGHTVSAQIAAPPPPAPPPSLKTVTVPEPDNLGEFVKDKVAAIALGKSLFWDMQVGSDGIQSCASCHFHAGADTRAKNQLNPGPNTVVNTGGLNYTLKPDDYPFHKLTNPDDRSSPLARPDSDDVSSSQGTFNSEFVDVVPGSTQDTVTYRSDPVFNVGGTNIRQVVPRNTPTVINAVFNFRNFWDGRAQNEFNGVNPFGSRDPDAKVVKATKPNRLEEVKISLKNSSLASQAVGPPISDFEMSATGRTFEEVGQKFRKGKKNKLQFRKGKKNKLPRELGKKLRFLRPLGKQIVHPEDSVLGAYSRVPETGLKPRTYEKMIQDAFQPEWWKSNQVIRVDDQGKRTFIKNPKKGLLATNEYTVMEYNFPIFFGLAIQMYEATLIANDTPYDQFQEGNTSALTEQQQQGLAIFIGQNETQGGGRCINCHSGPEFTDASVSKVSSSPLRRREGNIIDRGFNNIGVRPTFEDIGVGGDDPFGNPLSQARLAKLGRFNDPKLPLESSDIVGADGGFKTPGLRNVEITAPYFHNGGQLTLRQVVDFYTRGGDFHPIQGGDGEIQPVSILTLGTNPQEVETAKEALVAFLKSLTDERVRYHKAPFDHPQLFVTNGHPGDQTSVTNDGSGKATDMLLEIPAVGRNGLTSPLPTFLELPPQ